MTRFRPLVLVLFSTLVALPAQAFETAAREAILIEDSTGTVLFEKNADQPMPPSSMSKMMTIYVLFSHLADGTLSLDDTFPVSEKAWRKGGSKMFVEVGERVRVEDLIRGIIVQSGNDASIVVAEGLAGSEEAFAAELNRVAQRIGMTHSTFKNASGWPEEGHLTTARDLATLVRRTIHDFPQYYHYYSETTFTYAGIKQGNRNPLLYRDIGADGLKTGHAEEAGYGLAASAERDDRRLILVVNGLDSVRARARESERLFEYGFREFANYPLFAAGDTVAEAEVWLGETPTVPLVIEEDLVVTMKRRSRPDMTVKVRYQGPIPAPIAAGDALATLEVAAPEMAAIERPLRAGRSVGELAAVRRLGAAVSYLIWGPAAR